MPKEHLANTAEGRTVQAGELRSGSAAARQRGSSWNFEDNFQGVAGFLAGEKAADFTAFLAMAKEAGRLLNSFTPPENFVPDEYQPEVSITEEMARDLGAASLDDFYALVLSGEKRPDFNKNSHINEFFPKGPESVRVAMAAVDQEMKQLAKTIDDRELAWPPNKPGFEAAVRPLETRYEKLRASRANLLRVVRLWPRIKSEAKEWPDEAKRMWQKTRRLEEAVTLLLESIREAAESQENEGGPSGRDRGRRSLTRVSQDLAGEVNAARALLSDDERLDDGLETILTDIDNFLAVVVDGSQPDRDWEDISRRFKNRLSDLEKEERRLKDEVARVKEALVKALGDLAETEKRLVGRRDAEMRDRLETVGKGSAALWRSVVERRRELAKLYFALPPRIGRPVYLENIFLSSGLALGKSQALLEDLKHRLGLMGGRLSTTNKLRAEGETLMDKLGLFQSRMPKLKLARRRFSALVNAIDQRTSAADALERMRLSDRRLARGVTENESMRKELEAAVLEKERLEEQLVFARQTLSEVGLLKSRLLKVSNKKNDILRQVDQERLRLSSENEKLRLELDELAAKRTRLASMYSIERNDIKRLTAELKKRDEALEETRELLAERRELEERLAETRREKDVVEARRLEVEGFLNEQSRQLTLASARVESLSAELDRHREELGRVAELRASWAEKMTALRRRLELLSQAHRSLLKTVDRQKRSLSRVESERDTAVDKLTRQKKNILRLAAARQELRTELGTTRLRLADLEKERDEIFIQLDGARREKEDAEFRAAAADEEKRTLTVNLADAERKSATAAEEKKALAASIEEIEQKVAGDLAPFIRILGEALWRSEAQLKRARTASGRLMDQFKLEADVREANLRLKAASREIDFTERAKSERRQFEAAVAEKEEELTDALKRNSEMRASLIDSEGVARQNQELSEKVSRLDGRTAKLRQALGLLKQRSDKALEDARLMEENLRGLTSQQSREIETQKIRLAELEPMVAHFLDQAARYAPQGSQAHDIIRQMQGENKMLGAQDTPGEAVNTSSNYLMLDNELLRSQLDELQPLVAFLAKSFVTNVAELAQARQDRGRLAEELASFQSTHEVLEASLQSRETELAEVRDQAFALAQERDQLQGTLSAKAEEISVLKSELAQADRDLAENDGRLEASWAALNYLGTKADDALARVKGKLDNQTRQVDVLSSEIKERDEQIKNLEDRQDKLALLYWTLVSKAVSSAGSRPPVAQALREAGEALLPAPSGEGGAVKAQPAAEAAPALGGGAFSLGKQMLEGAKKVARRSLFALIMTGGLILSAPMAASAAHLPGSAPTALPSPGQYDEPSFSTRFNSSYIGRAVSLEVVDSSTRLAGRAAVESSLTGLVKDMAESHGLTNGEFLRLVREARGVDATVHLTDFKGRSGSFILLETHLPKLTRQLMAWPEEVVIEPKLTSLMKSASDFKPNEGSFWERLFFDYLASEEPGRTIDALLAHLAQKATLANLTRPEFAGRLAPFPEIENMGPDSFIAFMATHIQRNWPNFSTRPREHAARRLAGDIYFSARLFKLPVTLLAAQTHQEVETHLTDFFKRGATMGLLHRASTLANLARRLGLDWEPGRPPLCDLDTLLEASRKETKLDPENIYKKKMALVQAYNKHVNAGQNLLASLDGAWPEELPHAGRWAGRVVRESHAK